MERRDSCAKLDRQIPAAKSLMVRIDSFIRRTGGSLARVLSWRRCHHRMPLQGLFGDYQVGSFYDEMFAAPDEPRPHYAKIFEKLASMVPSQFEERRQHADLSFLLQGITFTVYSDGRGTERLFPFDLIPRIIPQLGMAAHRSRTGAARRGAEFVSAGRLREAAHFRGPPDSALAGLLLQAFHARSDRHRSAARHSHAHLRHRPGARFQDRRILRSRRQCAHSQRHLLRAREPAGHDAHVSRTHSRHTKFCPSITIPPSSPGFSAAFRRGEATTRKSFC